MADPAAVETASSTHETSSDEAWVARLIDQLDQLQAKGQLVTYLELADLIGLSGPQRIHRLTGWLETTLARDHALGRAPRAALVVSRFRGGLPAPGFFQCAQALGMMGAESPQTFHGRVLDELGHERVNTRGYRDQKGVRDELE